MSAVGKQYIVCALIRNALTFLYQNTTSEYFQLDPPTIESYFAMTFGMTSKLRHFLFNHSKSIKLNFM